VTPEEKYVAAAYLVVFVVVLVYVLIMATKLQRLEREVGELADRLRTRQRDAGRSPEREEAEVG
jgi:CcmD family protein